MGLDHLMNSTPPRLLGAIQIFPSTVWHCDTKAAFLGTPVLLDDLSRKSTPVDPSPCTLPLRCQWVCFGQDPRPSIHIVRLVSFPLFLVGPDSSCGVYIVLVWSNTDSDAVVGLLLSVREEIPRCSTSGVRRTFPMPFLLMCFRCGDSRACNRGHVVVYTAGGAVSRDVATAWDTLFP